MEESENVMELRNISFAFTNVSSGEYESMIIGGVSFAAKNGEFVSIIGPSGCGKSTLLRIMAGLIAPRGGKVFYYGNEIKGPTEGISFVFQDFALLPWLTNVENVKLGLSLSGMPDEKQEKVAMQLLDQFGLSGFGRSYPNSLSGGMKQRVGIARAIASQPKLLLMDEPFSALDALTANSLRADVMYMLRSKDISVSSVILVTHNVEEAVELSNSIVVLSDRPSRIKEIVHVDMPYPRNKRSDKFTALTDKIYHLLTK